MMKNLLLVAVLAACLPSCISGAAEENVLLPSLQLAYPGVRADFDRGLEVSVEADQPGLTALMDQLEAALQSGDKTALRMIHWPELAQYVRIGIGAKVAADEISQGVADILTQRLDNFTEGLNVLLSGVRLPPSKARAVWYNTKHGTFYGGRMPKLEMSR